ncbi:MULTISPECIES: response regulator transcription factor [unclassified Duganella]|uniref:response regulator transcription factor n=1 Tax=unclassified Duganella TaxID=2636909 RepID=UPI000883A61D|nr:MULTISPECIES: response regulator transcription factor [unclassified Duganella]SDF71510.1 two component transcriptional regulator, LuxR family [Duganella sp. OV458]SDI57860.1 two component transcriptional regulator, LuxR family [Duganella sp. OV510]
MNFNTEASIVLVVDDVPENLAVLHDALDESGYTVLVANNGEAALLRAAEAQPHIILLDAIMPGMDGFETCRQLKSNLATRHIPVIFMTGLTEAEHVVNAFDAGGNDYVTKPLRTSEVLARIASHMQTARLVDQARSALDAFGNAVIAMTPRDGRIVWQTPLARTLMQGYMVDAELPAWLQATQLAHSQGQSHPPLTLARGSRRLIFSAAEFSENAQWMIVLREESDVATIESLMACFKLTQRESEVLNWVIKGKTNRDIGDILGTSPRTVNKHLEHVFIKLGVETRTSAAAVALSKIRAAAV